MRLTTFGRGRDRKPRKRKLKKLIANAASIAGNAGYEGIGVGGILATGGLIARPNNTMLQANLARAGLAAGGLYGAYQGIKALRKKNQNPLRRLYEK